MMEEFFYTAVFAVFGVAAIVFFFALVSLAMDLIVDIKESIEDLKRKRHSEE